MCQTMVVMDEILSIKNFFASYHIQLSTEWLQSCVDWCKEENLPPNYAIKDLQIKVYEQWLLLDLRDVEIPCLPPDLSNKKQYSLNGHYALQMMKVIDISRPKHWQLQRIRNSVSKNTDEENESSKRVLQLTLTDGVQEVEAMEYKPISSLNLNMTPGIKILISGLVSVRRGRLMLQNENIKILGGEVEELIVPNAAENVLAKSLNLPLNPNPKVIEENLLRANRDMFSEAGGVTRSIPQHQNNTSVSPTNQQPNLTTNHQNNQSSRQESPSTPTRRPIVKNKSKPLDFSTEEEMRIAEEIDMLMEVEREFDKSANIKRNKTPDMFDDMDINDFDFSNIDAPTTVIKTSNKSSKAPTTVQNQQPNVIPQPGSCYVKKQSNVVDMAHALEVGNDLFENIDIDSHLEKIDDKSSQMKTTPQKPVILSIEKLLKNIPNISNGKFKIKASFKSIVEKLTIGDDGYHLVVEVTDETGDIAVKFHSDVVADLAECCPATLLSLRTGVEEKNANAERRVMDTLKRLKEKLLLLDSVIEVQVNGKESRPVVINILDIP